MKKQSWNKLEGKIIIKYLLKIKTDSIVSIQNEYKYFIKLINTVNFIRFLFIVIILLILIINALIFCHMKKSIKSSSHK